jgi:hypothetical protein
MSFIAFIFYVIDVCSSFGGSWALDELQRRYTGGVLETHAFVDTAVE